MNNQKSADPQKVVIKDSIEVKNIFVQLDIKNSTTKVLSNFSAWDNLAFLMEALGVTTSQCISEGIPKSKVYGAVKKYMMQILGEYKILTLLD